MRGEKTVHLHPSGLRFFLHGKLQFAFIQNAIVIQIIFLFFIHYFRDFVQPDKKFRQPTDSERAALIDLREALGQLEGNASAEDIQNVVYEIGRREPFLDEKKKAKDGKPGVSLDWFNLLYQVLLGQEKGPRFGSFVAVYGVQNTVDMIDGALARSA